MARRILALLSVVVMLSVAGVAPAASAGDAPGPDRYWVGAWSAAPQAVLPGTLGADGFQDQTLRMIVRPSIGGQSIRLRLSNAFGDRPVLFSDVRVGVRQLEAGLVQGSAVTVRFGGRQQVTVPRGATVLSDAVPLRVRADQELAVSMYVPAATGPATTHRLPRVTNYIAAGNVADQANAAGFTTTTTSWFFISGVDVAARPNAGAVLTVGDSITDGFASTVDAWRSYPDFLADRLQARRGRPLAVLNQGISGNRVLNDSPCCGVNALARIDRDVLAQSGVESVILLEGINDIGFSQLALPTFAPATEVTADEIIFGYEQFIDRLSEKGIQVIGGTLTPFEGAGYFTEAGEQKRQAVNEWIRTSGAFDAVIDFDAALRDPANPRRLLAAYDSGDRLHPNDAGYRAMADAVDLRILIRPTAEQLRPAA